MKWTLETLMKAVGCDTYPERWKELFDKAMREYEEHGCYLADTMFYDELEARYRCFGQYGEIYKAAAREVAADEVLGRFLTLLAMALRDDAYRKDDLANFSRPVTPKGKEAFGYEMVTGLAMCSQFEVGASNMRRRGIPESVIGATLALPVKGVESYARKHHGEWGFDLLGWYQRYIDGNLFQIGRLQYEFGSGFLGKAIVFQNQDGQIVSLAHEMELHRDGVALGAKHFEDEMGAWTPSVEETKNKWIGQAYASDGTVKREKITLLKEEWTPVLREGDPVLRLHIPPDGKMTPEMIDESLVQAKVFAQSYFPEYAYKAFACTSWLIDPQLCKLLDSESNIVKFTKRFHPFTRKSQAEGVFNFIFHKPDMNFAIAELPENTSLEKALKEYYLSGGAIYELEGIII